MPKNKIEDLRNHLFETIEMLKDKEIDVDRARAIADISKQIIDSAKVEIQFVESIGGKGSGFIPMEIGEPRENGELKLIKAG